ncbi:MAG: radical SAM domain-containing protein, partial [Acidimicrobiales bacterium]
FPQSGPALAAVAAWLQRWECARAPGTDGKGATRDVSRQSALWRRAAEGLTGLARATRPVAEETRAALARRWAELPEHVRTDAQALGRSAVGCEGTHGVFPRCNFACTPCYHSAGANRVRVDGAHTVAQVERQMAYLAAVRGPRGHVQLIGGEVSLLDPDDHAQALAVMRRHGREPMSFTHGDFDYAYLEALALGSDGRPRFKRLSFAAHFDTTMRGRAGLRRPRSEAELNPLRQAFCDLFRRLRAEHGVRFFLAHNMTVTPGNVAQIPQVIEDCRAMGFNMFSFQPAAHVGDERRWTGDYRSLDPNEVWAKIEQGVGAHLPHRLFQTGDERCNRSTLGCYVGGRFVPVGDEADPADIAARDAFYAHLGGVHWNAPPVLLAVRLARVLAAHPRLVATAASWLHRRVRQAGGAEVVLRAARQHELVPMTFVMHRFMHAEDVKPAWELLRRGETSTDPRIRETQERLQACFYDMAHPETGEIVPACVQHSVLDPAENTALAELLPLPRVRRCGEPAATAAGEAGPC